MRPAPLVIALVAAGTLPSPRSAMADCVGAEAEVHRNGDSAVTVLPEGSCLFPTAWPTQARVGHEQRVGGLPSGAPDGVAAAVWVPFP